MSSSVHILWLMITIYITILYDIDAIDIENSHSVSKWWYQFILHNTGLSPVTAVYVRSFGITEYIECKFEDWPPYPWTCETTDATPYIAPLTVKLINSLGQQVIINDVVGAFTGSTRYNTTYSFENQPTIKPTISPTPTPTTLSPTLSPNTDPTTSPTTATPTSPTISPTNIPTAPTNTPTTTSTTAATPDTPFLGSTLQWPYYVGYINTVLCDIGDDISCLASIGLPGYSYGTPHQYNVLNFGSYIITADTAINALQFWFNPRNYLNLDTITSLTGSPTSSNAEIRIILHNIYAQGGIKIFLSTFGEQDDDALDVEIIDNWMQRKMSPSSIGYKLASIVRNYYFDGININFDTESIYFDQYSTGEQNLIILTEALNSALNRNSLNPYFIITHTAPSILFEKSINYPMGGYLMVHEFCDVITWYNIKFYDSGTITYDTFDTLFISQNTSIDKLILGVNKQNVAISAAQIVITRSADSDDLNGYLPATTFSNIIKEAISRGYPYWRTGFMVYDFYTDEQDEFLYSSELITAFLPTPEPTALPVIVTQVQYPTVPRYSPETDEDDSFDLLNLNSYGWGEWFFLITMFIILAVCCVIIGCCYHRYKVKDKILTDEQLNDLEDDMNRTAISDSWRRLSKLLVRSPTVDAVAMNEEQATRVLGQSICGKQENIELTDQMEEEHPVVTNGLNRNPKSVDQINQDDLEELVGQSVDKGTEHTVPIHPEQDEDDDDENENENVFPTNTGDDGDGNEETNDDTEENTEETPSDDNNNSSNNDNDDDEIQSNLEGNENVTITND